MKRLLGGLGFAHFELKPFMAPTRAEGVRRGGRIRLCGYAYIVFPFIPNFMERCRKRLTSMHLFASSLVEARELTGGCVQGVYP